MTDGYSIHLNFLAVQGSVLAFTIYRKLRDSTRDDRPSESVSAYKLPKMTLDEENWQSYWVSELPLDGFEPFQVAADFNVELTKSFLFLGLRKAVTEQLAPDLYHFPDNVFIQEVSFNMQTHKEGHETLVVQPYFLKVERQFGFLVDFHFRMAKGIAFDRKVQQLSLSLDRKGKRNLDYYVDRVTKIHSFVEKRWDVLSAIKIPGSSNPVSLSKEFIALNGERLRSKVYVFGGDRESRSQFAGLRQFGPLSSLDGIPKLLFVFREQDRQAARTLAGALCGSNTKENFGFPGFHALFKTDLEIDGDPVVVRDFSQEEILRALQRVQEECRTRKSLIPVIVLPEGEEEGYLRQKALFVHSGIPTQVCTLRVLRDPDTLKWAIGNLALQLFCKAGGQPWKVRPTPAERSLIIGIAQSHKIKLKGERYSVERYFAFSVLTDSSGLFQEIQVLGESDNQDAYLNKLRDSLRGILSTSADSFKRVVVHTSFKLQHKEMKAIEETVRQAANDKAKCQFAVVKVNHRCRFFGVNRSVNSLVPYEATQVHLGPGEYLVWFEGISPGTPTVNKAFPGPTHLQFLRISKDNPISPDVLLQDLVNLSGANWRGFNAKSTPVSVFYCHLVADLVHDFHERGLPLPAVKDIRPWFL